MRMIGRIPVLSHVLFDTNIYLYHYRQYPDAVDAMTAEVAGGAIILLSVIQISELLSTTAVDHDQRIRTDMEGYIAAVDQVINVSEEIAWKAAEIRRLWKTRTGKNLKLPDAIIAATALLHNATLIGNNDKDFAPLRDMVALDYRNPIQSQEELRTFLR